MASIRKNELKSGTSYRIVVKVKSQRTGKVETKSMTWKVPKGLNEEQIQKQLKQVADEFEFNEKCKETSFKVNNNTMRLYQFIDKWLERLALNRSKNFYRIADASTKIIKDFFGDIKLSEITPVSVQDYMDSISKHIVTRHSARMIKNLKNVMLSKLLKIRQLTELSGVKRSVYESALAGNPIRYENAVAMCKALQIPYGEYFEDIKVEKPYAKESIKKHRVVLSSLLASAKKLGLIEDNYASPEYLEPIRGFKVEVPILNEQEAKILQKELEKESDPRRQISLMIVLLMGLRRAELAGLEWKDIDFENKTMTIARSSFRDKGGKTYTKSTKTETSVRCISMPDKLITYLLKYREWWLNRKSILKAVWKDNDRLLLSDDGRIVCPTMYVKWLHTILERAGLPKVTLHSLRHTNITLQLIAGVDMKTVSTRAGHARASTTSDFYSHFLKSSDKNASAKINDIFNREKGLYSGDNN